MKKKLLITAVNSEKFNKIINILNEHNIPFTYKQDIFTESVSKTTFKWDFYVQADYHDYARHLLHGI